MTDEFRYELAALIRRAPRVAEMEAQALEARRQAKVDIERAMGERHNIEKRLKEMLGGGHGHERTFRLEGELYSYDGYGNISKLEVVDL